MNSDRRTFLQTLGMAAAVAAVPTSLYANHSHPMPAGQPVDFGLLTADQQSEEYWAQVRQLFALSPDVINLNSANLSPMLLPVEQQLIQTIQAMSQAPSLYAWRHASATKEANRSFLAQMLGCPTDELALVRNATEGMESIILGFPFNRGDEVILAKQDYSSMLTAWQQRAKRDGIVLKIADFDALPAETEREIIAKYADLVTPKTRLVQVTHMINWNGNILPVAKISRAVKAKNPDCLVMADSAQSFAHIQFSMADLEADFVAASLHKWFASAYGAGFLWMKKHLIKDIFPLFAAPEGQLDGIGKFEHGGTRFLPIDMTIQTAGQFNQILGIARKEARLRFLKDYWLERALKIDRVQTQSSLKKQYACGIAAFSIDGISANDVAKKLNDKNIHVVGIKVENINGVRVSPNVFTALPELDRLLTEIEQIART